MQSAKIVSDAATRELDRMQEAYGVDKQYRIKPLTIFAPDEAALQASGKLRALVGMLVLGSVLLFIVISILDALAAMRAERMRSLAVDLTNGWHAGDLPYAYEQGGKELSDEPSPR